MLPRFNLAADSHLADPVPVQFGLEATLIAQVVTQMPAGI
jgi:hypothetical protein